MESLYRLKDMLSEELDKIVEKGQLTSGSLDVVKKLTASIHYIDEILQMQDGEYSNDGYSGARGRGRSARRDSMGRYSSDYSGGMSNDGYSRGYSNEYSRDGYSRDGYSREGSYVRGYSRDSKQLMGQLHSMLQETQDPETKKALERCISQIEG